VVLGTLAAAADDDSLHARGAVGLVHLSTEPEQYLMYVRSRGDARLRLSDSTIARSLEAALPSLVASPHLSRRFNAAAGEDRIAVLPDTITVRVQLRRQQVESSNVTCLLEGTDPGARDTAVVYTAHYDHLGTGLPDARGDSIFNGFSDNAAGVAMLLAIADAMKTPAADRPRHSVLFLFFTGEEQGLLGSDYYVARPQWPTERMLGVINLDAGAPPARPWSWRIAGGHDNPLSRLARDIAAERGWSATTSPATPNSDYYPFARVGVPAIFIVPGSGPYQGLSVDSSQALRRRWDRYHHPADEWSADFPFAGLGRYAEYAYLLGRALDQGRKPRSAGSLMN
jgi:Zn-dependent M28 family amino/carboxypeptidase